MVNVEINVPDNLYERLRRLAGADDEAVSDFALVVIQQEVERLERSERRELTMTEWQARRKTAPILTIRES